MYLLEELQNKWSKVMDHKNLPEIRDNHRKAVTAVILENTDRFFANGGAETARPQHLKEDAPVNSVGAGMGYVGSEAGHNQAMAGYDPILIPLLRRAVPQMIAFDLCGVQPMSGPTGLIFCMKARYGAQATTNAEALFDAALTGGGTGGGTGAAAGSSPTDWVAGTGHTTANAEGLDMNHMAFSIERVAVEAKTRGLQAGFSLELQQDLKAVHGLDAESELSNILATEILAEINREVIRTIYYVAKAGAQHNTAAAGTFNLDLDSNGRWFVERVKGLMFQIEREANAIAIETRRGRGNFILCSSDVASALSVAGLLDSATALKDNLNVDPSSTTFAGVLNGRFKVYVDPYIAPAATNYFTVGYKGATAYDAGVFYCPYIPLQLVRAVDPTTYQPKLGFKTRYGICANPFYKLGSTGAADSTLTQGANVFYRKVTVTNLM